MIVNIKNNINLILFKNGDVLILRLRSQKSFSISLTMSCSISILLLVALTKAQLYNTSLYSLGSNLVLNPTFSNPNIGGSMTVYYPPGGIPSWTCNEGQIVNIPSLCSTFGPTCGSNLTQGFDLDVNVAFELLSQGVSLNNSAQYLLSVEWVESVVNPIGKAFEIKINSTSLANLTTTTTNYVGNMNQFLITGSPGIMNISFQEFGTVPEGLGVLLIGVFLQELVPIPSPPTPPPTPTSTSPTDSTALAVFNGIMLNNFTTGTNCFPGNRIFLYTITNFMLTFDHLQFYYFHRQNLSYYSEILLSNTYTLAQERGQFPQRLLRNCDNSICTSLTSFYDGLVEGLDKKKNYSDAFILSRNPNGLGFFSNNMDFFFFELPLAFGVYFLFACIFRLLFNYRISKYIRKYSFYGIFLFIVYEGNVEQFAFYFFSQCKNLFSVNFSHKLVNVLLIYFFFILMIFSVGGLLFFTFHYRKLVKYFLEDSKEGTMEAVVIESLERSIFPLVFGCVHALLIDNLALQTILLAGIEVCYFLAKLCTLRSVTPRYKFKTSMFLVTSLLRLIFIFTFYLYQQKGSPLIINLVHYDLVWIYLICWVIQLFHDSAVFISEVYEAVTTLCDNQKGKKSNKQPQVTEKEKKTKRTKKSKSKLKPKSKKSDKQSSNKKKSALKKKQTSSSQKKKPESVRFEEEVISIEETKKNSLQKSKKAEKLSNKKSKSKQKTTRKEHQSIKKSNFHQEKMSNSMEKKTTTIRVEDANGQQLIPPIILQQRPKRFRKM